MENKVSLTFTLNITTRLKRMREPELTALKMPEQRNQEILG